ncbi:MAG: hypothetical protein ACJAZO_001412 [Myxococcota bacterium]
MAVTQAWNGDFEVALLSLEHVVQLDPTNLGGLAFQARVLSWDGRFSDSDAAWEALRNDHPNDPNLWSGTADLYRSCGALRRARRAYETALALDPNHAEAAAGQEARAQQSSVRWSGWGGATFGAGASGGVMVEARLACSLRGTASISLPAPTDSASSWAKGVRTDLSVTRSAAGKATIGGQASVSGSALRAIGFVAQGTGNVRFGGQTGVGLVQNQPPTWLAGPTLDAALGGQSWSRLSVVTGLNRAGLDDIIGVASVGYAEQLRLDFATRWTAETTLHSLSASVRSPMTPSGQATISVQTTLNANPLVTVNVGWVVGHAP